MAAVTYDLAVIGGGPAGAAAAWTAAARGLRTVVVERGGFPRDKVCGEYFSAEAAPLLRRIAPDLVAAAPRIERAVFITAGGGRAEFALPRAALGISRWKLDAALWRAARAMGADALAGTTVTRARECADGYELTLGGGERVLACTSLIVAPGRWWSIPGLSSQEPAAPALRRRPAWVGVKARFRGLELAAVEMYCFRGGYCGLAPVENGWANACCLIQRERAGELGACRDFGRWVAAVAGRPLRERLRGGEQATPTVTTAPVTVGPRSARLGKALVAGDASGFIDPFTGDGMARAMLSGALAAECLAERRAQEYDPSLRRAGERSYRAGALARLAIGLPEWAQAAVVLALARPLLARRLVEATRWRL